MNVSKSELIKALAPQMKVLIKKPDWAEFVKTGIFKERPPVDSDWWYMRAASMLLKIQRLQPVGVSKLRTKYGGRKNRGVAPEHFFKGSGKILRVILQQLETAGLLKQEKKSLRRGRLLTAKAQSLIAKTIKAVEKQKPKPVEKPVEKPVVEKHVEKKEEIKEAKEVKEAKETPVAEQKIEHNKKEQPAETDKPAGQS